MSKKVTPADKQYMAAHARKVLGTYVGLKLISDEIALIDLNDTKNLDKNKKKWSCLNKLQDELFEAAGDMRDFLRVHASSFGQLKDGVKKNIPDFAQNKNKDTIEKTTQDKQKFIEQLKKNLAWHIPNYTYFENFMGWHMREDAGLEIEKALNNNVYKKNMPRINSTSATVMLMEGLDNLSRELKYIETVCQRDVNLKGVVTHLIEKFKFGDINGFKEFVAFGIHRPRRQANHWEPH